MHELLSLLTEHKFASSILIIASFLLLKYASINTIFWYARRKEIDRRAAVNHLKNLFNLLLFITLLVFWANELQNFAFSIAAFAVAIVIATRELIQCIIGFFYLVSTRPFRVGDWIQVGEYCGEVAEMDYIKTSLLEVDLSTYKYTGKTLYIPNNKLITSAIKNLNFLKRYANHIFVIIRDASVNPFNFLDTLQEKAQEYCSEFYDVATRYNQTIERRLDVRISGPDPEIKIRTTDIGDTAVEISIFCPTEKALEIEQKLTQDFLNLWFDKKETLEHKA